MSDYGDFERTPSNYHPNRNKLHAIIIIVFVIGSIIVVGGIGMYVITTPHVEYVPPPPPVYEQDDVMVYITANDTSEVWYAEPEFGFWDSDALGTFSYHELPLNHSSRNYYLGSNCGIFESTYSNGILKAQLWFREKYRLDNDTWYYPETHGPFFITTDYTQVFCNYTWELDRHTVYVEVYFNAIGY